MEKKFVKTPRILMDIFTSYLLASYLPTRLKSADLLNERQV